ncbi:hypothetical protein ScPMuIL_003783 [Solemya velum]
MNKKILSLFPLLVAATLVTVSNSLPWSFINHFERNCIDNYQVCMQVCDGPGKTLCGEKCVRKFEKCLKRIRDPPVWEH